LPKGRKLSDGSYEVDMDTGPETGFRRMFLELGAKKE